MLFCTPVSLAERIAGQKIASRLRTEVRSSRSRRCVRITIWRCTHAVASRTFSSARRRWANEGSRGLTGRTQSQ